MKNNIVTFFGRFTRCLEATPVQNIEAETVASVLINAWVARFVVPVTITTDQGRGDTSIYTSTQGDIYTSLAEYMYGISLVLLEDLVQKQRTYERFRQDFESKDEEPQTMFNVVPEK